MQEFQRVDEALQVANTNICLLLAAHSYGGAKFCGSRGCHFVIPALVNRGKLFQQRQTFGDRGLTIADKGPFCRCHGDVYIFATAHTDRRNRTFGRGVQNLNHAGNTRIDPRTIDIEFAFIQHVSSLRSRFGSAALSNRVKNQYRLLPFPRKSTSQVALIGKPGVTGQAPV